MPENDAEYSNSIRSREEYLRNNSVRYKEFIEKALEEVLKISTEKHSKFMQQVIKGPFEVKISFDKIKLNTKLNCWMDR